MNCTTYVTRSISTSSIHLPVKDTNKKDTLATTNEANSRKSYKKNWTSQLLQKLLADLDTNSRQTLRSTQTNMMQ